MPIAIGSIIPKNDAKWVNFIKLLQIQQLCTSPITTETTIESLTICIACHNYGYQEVYPDASLLPQMHYLVHLPNRIQSLGQVETIGAFEWKLNTASLRSTN